MKKKMHLNELSVQSFITAKDITAGLRIAVVQQQAETRLEEAEGTNDALCRSEYPHVCP